ncbi:MAG TPA: helix-turn-helix domain-containing protein [Candidatus Binataceae bacterium]|nr:helix-turn-helix domain-containing protein [Candidatus Binataceae bacterium]
MPVRSTLQTTKSLKPFGEWLDDKIEEWNLREEVQEEVNRLMLQQKIAERRRRLGISQKELARRTGVSQPMVAKFESGRFKNITLHTLVRTARALGAGVKIDLFPLPGHSKNKTVRAGAGGR